MQDSIRILFLAGLLACLAADKAIAQDGPRPAEGKQEPSRAPEIVVIGKVESEGVPVVPLGSVGSRDVFGPEKIKQIGARDMNDLIQNLPGISTRPYNGGEAAAPSFSTRGLPDDGLTEYINVLIDGVPANPLPYGWTAFSFLPITIERIYAIDAIRGAYTIRHSPNTVGGVLNFITRPIPRDREVLFKTTFGSFDYASTMVFGGGTVGDVGMAVTYVDRRGEGYRQNGGFDQQDFNFKVHVDRGEGDWVAASASYMESEHQAPGGLTQAQFMTDRFGNARPFNRFDGFRGVADVVLHDAAGSGFSEFFASASETGRHLRAQRPHFGTPASISEWDDESFFVQAGGRLEQPFDLLGAEHTLHAGVRVHRDWIPSWKLSTEPYPFGAAAPAQDAAYSLTSLSFHVDDTFAPAEGVTLHGGARVEWIPQARGSDALGSFAAFDDEFFTVLPGIGASVEVTDELAVYGNYFHGFRPPQVWGFGFVPPGGTNLVFEKSRAYEAGVRVQSLGGLYGSAAVWRTEFDDYTTFQSGFYENLGRILSQGIDLVLDWDAGELIPPLDGLVLSGSITVQDSELKTGIDAGNETPYAWETKATWRASYETEDQFEFSIGGVYMGDSFSDTANSILENANGNLGLNPAWTIWDARIAKEFEISDSAEIEIAVGATNLLDTDWHVHSRGGFFGGGKVAGPPRQFYVAVFLVVNA